MEGQAEKITPAMAKVEMKPSPALSLVTKAPKTIEGRRIGVLVTDGTQASFVAALRRGVEKAGAQLQVVAPKIGGAAGTGGRIDADHQLAGGPSVLFDAVVVAPSEAGAQLLERDAAAIDWIRDAYGHLKVIGVLPTAERLLERAGLAPDRGIVEIVGAKEIDLFIEAARAGRVWEREPGVRPPL